MFNIDINAMQSYTYLNNIINIFKIQTMKIQGGEPTKNFNIYVI